MSMAYQRGAISLFWAALLMALVMLAGMTGLMSTRDEQNYFLQAWKRFSKGSEETLRQATPGTQGASDIRKCLVDGKVVYSNVECTASNPSTTKLTVTDSRGIEAPKLPGTDSKSGEPEQLRQKALERVIGQ